jgi:hypothetical protein
MSNRRKRVTILTVIAFVLPALACSLVSRTAAPPPPTPTPISTEEYGAMQTELQSAAATAAAGGKVHLEFTEGQLTAAANTELQSQGESRLKDLQIGLDAGLLNLSGTVNQNNIEMPLTISMKITVDDQGKPHTQILSGKVGMFAIPEDMLKQITDQVDLMLTSQVQANGSNLFIESLTIDNGKIDIVAQMK